MTRRKLDAYYSPTDVAWWLLQNQQVGLAGTVLECSAGDGAIAKPLSDQGLPVWTNDINEELETDYHYDITDPNCWLWQKQVKFDWIVTNPPFTAINEMLPLAFDHCKRGLALYVRNSVTEPTYKRQVWLKQHEDHLAQIIFCPRVSFTGDGKTDNCSCNWYIWTKQKVSGCKLTWVTK